MNNWFTKRFSWILEEKKEDTRQLFQQMTDRKPVSWDSVTNYDYFSLSVPHQKALMDLPVIDDSLESPWDKFSERPQRKELILFNHFNGYTYYVNTEGYDWPRHMFEILNFPHEDREQ